MNRDMSKLEPYFFKIGNKIRNTGRTRFKKGHKSSKKGKTWEEFYGKEKAQELKKKKSLANMGRPAWNAGLEEKNKMAFNCSYCKNDFKVPKTKKRTFCSRKCWWNNTYRGSTSFNRRLRESSKWTKWRELVFERDKYTCLICKTKNGVGLGHSVELHPHHTISVSKAINSGNLDSVFDVSNGFTMCKPCHLEQHKGKNHGII